MDVFSRAFLPAAAHAGVTVTAASRHLPVLRRCVEPDDSTVLVARCTRPDRPAGGDFLLLLTHRRLVVTHETRPWRRLRLHLNADLRHLSNVTWSPDARATAVELAVTAVDGVRERFRLRAAHAGHVGQLDELLGRVLRPGGPAVCRGTLLSLPA